MTKANHFKNAAKATRALEPRISTFFGDADQEVRQLHEAGQLTLRTFVDGRGVSAAADDDAGDCGASLSCSRPDTAASGSSACDIHGMVGAVCTHTIPLRGAFIDMHGPEQFAYYLVLLKHLVGKVGDASWKQASTQAA